MQRNRSCREVRGPSSMFRAAVVEGALVRIPALAFARNLRRHIRWSLGPFPGFRDLGRCLYRTFGRAESHIGPRGVGQRRGD